MAGDVASPRVDSGMYECCPFITGLGGLPTSHSLALNRMMQLLQVKDCNGK